MLNCWPLEHCFLTKLCPCCPPALAPQPINYSKLWSNFSPGSGNSYNIVYLSLYEVINTGLITCPSTILMFGEIFLILESFSFFDEDECLDKLPLNLPRIWNNPSLTTYWFLVYHGIFFVGDNCSWLMLNAWKAWISVSTIYLKVND